MRGKDTKNYQVNRILGGFDKPTLLDAVEIEELIRLFNEGITETAKILFVRQLVIRRIMIEDSMRKYRVLQEERAKERKQRVLREIEIQNIWDDKEERAKC